VEHNVVVLLDQTSLSASAGPLRPIIPSTGAQVALSSKESRLTLRRLTFPLASLVTILCVTTSLKAQTPACSTTQIMVDNICRTLTPWANGTTLPDGTLVAIRLRSAMLLNQPAVPWVKYLGVQPDNTIDATDETLLGRDIFTIRTATYFSNIWFSLRAANGSYVGKPLAYDVPKAEFDANTAGIMSRYGKDAGRIGVNYSYTWVNVPNILDNTQIQTYCLSPETTSNKTNITKWSLNGCGFFPIDYFVVQ
jgi:hypothetical protein